MEAVGFELDAFLKSGDGCFPLLQAHAGDAELKEGGGVAGIDFFGVFQCFGGVFKLRQAEVRGTLYEPGGGRVWFEFQDFAGFANSIGCGTGGEMRDGHVQMEIGIVRSDGVRAAVNGEGVGGVTLIEIIFPCVHEAQEFVSGSALLGCCARVGGVAFAAREKNER